MTTLVNRRGNILVWVIGAACIFPVEKLPAETTETILIRQALEKDRSGRRRGVVELVLSQYDGNRFVRYSANGMIDPLGWRVRNETLTSYADALGQDLRIYRYDIQRSVTLISVRLDKAFVTTVDKGLVIDRNSGAEQALDVTRLWTFRKEDDEWLVSALVDSLGDLATGPYTGAAGGVDEDIAMVLKAEAQAWNSGSAAGVIDHYDGEYVGYDAYHTILPATWAITFNDAEEFEDWLDKRLSLTSYDVQREILHASKGAGGLAAVALTREKVTAKYRGGTAVHSQEGYAFWTLSRGGGSWKVTNLVQKLQRPSAQE